MTRAALVLALLVVGGGGCRCDTFRFYNVNRTFEQECNILPQGEFCDDEVETLPPPRFEVWAVERGADEIRVTVDEEVWIAVEPDPDGNPNALIADKLEVATREPGPCTTTITRSFSIVADDIGLNGTIDEKNRLTGPEDCGETPRGARISARLDGELTGAP